MDHAAGSGTGGSKKITAIIECHVLRSWTGQGSEDGRRTGRGASRFHVVFLVIQFS